MTDLDQEALHAILKVLISKTGAKGDIETAAKRADGSGNSELANAIAEVFRSITGDHINARSK